MDELKKQLAELLKLVTGVQSKNSEMETKYDGLIKTSLEKITADTTKAAEDLQKMQEALGEKQKRIEQLEKSVAMFNERKGTKDNSIVKGYYEKLDGYLRRGVAIDNETVEKFHEYKLKEVNPFIPENELKNAIQLLTSKTANEGYFCDPIEKAAIEIAEHKLLQVGVNPDGGYWVQPARSQRRVERFFETSPMRSIASIETISSDKLEMIVDDNEGVTGGWVYEKESRTETVTPKIGLLEIPVDEQYAMPKTTQKMLDDSGFDVAGWLDRKTRDKMNRTENTAYVSGDGFKKPRGFLTLSAWSVAGTYEREKLEHPTSGADGEVSADNLIDLQNILKDVYQAAAVWFMKRTAWGSVLKLKTSGTGKYLIDPQLLRNGQGQLVLLGKPVVFADDMPAVATDSLSYAYGDFGVGYTIVDRIGFRVIRDNITEKGFVLFYITKRTGGEVSNYESVKILKLSA